MRILLLSALVLSANCVAQTTPAQRVQQVLDAKYEQDNGNGDDPSQSPEGRPVYVLPPGAAQRLRENAWRNQMSVQIIEPVVVGNGQTYRKIGVNCFEPSVSVQYTENRQMYSSVFTNWSGQWQMDSSVSQRDIPFDVEPTEQELDGYMQRVCPSLAW